MEGNPFIRKVPNYRKRMIIAMKELTYLDSMPVFEDERRMTEAWGRGGVEAERAEREKIALEKREKDRRNFEALENMLSQARKEYQERGEKVGHSRDENDQEAAPESNTLSQDMDAVD
jgi:dynein assembly factor 1